MGEAVINLTFGQALEALKAGKRVCREGWNGKNMWLVLTPSIESLPQHAVSAAVFARANELEEACNAIQTIKILPHIDMRSANGDIVVGWLASQTDMLSNDWCIIV